MAAPFELVAGPITLYVADAGTAHPEISMALPVAWTRLGANLSEDGVVVTPEETIERQKTLDSPRTKKLFRTEDDLDLTCTLLDLTAETFARVMNGASVSTQAAGSGTGGYRQFTLGRGSEVNLYALVARGVSPYDSEMNAQYYIPRCYIQSGGPTYVKGEAAGLELTIMCVDDETIGGYGIYRAQNVAASP